MLASSPFPKALSQSSSDDGAFWLFSVRAIQFDEKRTGDTLQTDFRFAGKYGYISDPDTGFDLLGARYYIPRLGRFLTQDPIGHAGGLNLYAYCENNPLSKVDPDGKQSVTTPSGQLTYYRTLYEMYKYEAMAGGSGATVLRFSQWVAQNAEKTTKFVQHHIMPQAYRDRIAQIFNGDTKFVDRYCVTIPKAMHTELHSGKGFGSGGWWNYQWGQFFANNPNPSQREVIRFSQYMMRSTGLAEKFNELSKYKKK